MAYSLVAVLRVINVLPGIYSNFIGTLGYATNYNALRFFDRSDLEVVVMGAIYALVVAIYKYPQSKYRELPILLILTLAILLSNTRSVIMGFLIVSSFFIMKKSNFFKKINIPLILIGMIPLIIFFNPIIIFESIFGSSFSYDNLFGQQSTFVFRNLVSLAYINHMDFYSYILGMNFGDQPLVFPELFYTDLNAGKVGLHNTYVETFYFFGAPLFIIFMLLVKNIFQSLILLDRTIINNRLISVSLLSFFFYIMFFLFWTFGQFSGIIFGLIIATIRNLEQDQPINAKRISL
tara:strand:- start:15646 stop:16521 length:876 start_codon:yes stop_codon:yes gene_type:complete